ncbi:MAG: hypothetical protein JST91_16480 [Actinobacteria bacterium]|nr:hypothetical protein [Actinomycetota bacterium]
MVLRVVAAMLGIAAAILLGQATAQADTGEDSSSESTSADPDPGAAADSGAVRVATSDPSRPSTSPGAAAAGPAASGRPTMRYSARRIAVRDPARMFSRVGRDAPKATARDTDTATSTRANGVPQPRRAGTDRVTADGAVAAVVEGDSVQWHPDQAAAAGSVPAQSPAPATAFGESGTAPAQRSPRLAPAGLRTQLLDRSPILRAVSARMQTAREPVDPLDVAGSVIVNTLAAAVRVFDPPAAIPSTSSVTRGTSTLDVGCGCGQQLDADWYFPNQSEEPVGTIYLQHGFLRSKDNMAGLAVQLAEQTNSIVVVPTVSSNPLAADGCWINGDPMHRAVADLFSGDRTALTDSASAAAGRSVTLPRQFVIAGHSAGGNLAAAAAGYTTTSDAIADLRAVIMFDAVDNGGAIAAASDKLSGANDRPIYQIAGGCSLCNAFGSGTTALVNARPDRFVGVQLMGGTHIDAEGASAGLAAMLVCGIPSPHNVAAVQTIATGWITDVFTGSETGLYGAAGERIGVDGATAVVLGVPQRAALAV